MNPNAEPFVPGSPGRTRSDARTTFESQNVYAPQELTRSAFKNDVSDDVKTAFFSNAFGAQGYASSTNFGKPVNQIFQEHHGVPWEPIPHKQGDIFKIGYNGVLTLAWLKSPGLIIPGMTGDAVVGVIAVDPSMNVAQYEEVPVAISDLYTQPPGPHDAIPFDPSGEISGVGAQFPRMRR